MSVVAFCFVVFSRSIVEMLESITWGIEALTLHRRMIPFIILIIFFIWSCRYQHGMLRTGNMEWSSVFDQIRRLMAGIWYGVRQRRF
jgi:hypothetical protein